MKVLWVTNVVMPIVSKELGLEKNNFGGWLTGIFDFLIKTDGIEVVICFPVSKKSKKIAIHKQNLEFYSFSKSAKEDKIYKKNEYEFSEIIKETKPDLIHIFGTEYPHSYSMIRAAQNTGMINKTIVSIQGLTSICAIHYYSSLPFRTIYGFTIRDFLKMKNIFLSKKMMERRGLLEKNVLCQTKNVIGRTTWDLAITKNYNPKVNYFTCNENLRSHFYGSSWSIDNIQKHSIFISQASYPIKGFHMVLDALEILKNYYPDITVYVAGNNFIKTGSSLKNHFTTTYYKYLKKKIKALNLNETIHFTGVLDETQMIERYLKSHVFVSASSIENSPNSVGEAMILGVPTVSSYVGGVPDMLTHGEEGFLYQYDSYYMLSHFVKMIFDDNKLATTISNKARIRALSTHNPIQNNHVLLGIYDNLIIKNREIINNE